MVTGKGHVKRTKVRGSFGIDEGIAIEDIYGDSSRPDESQGSWV